MGRVLLDGLVLFACNCAVDSDTLERFKRLLSEACALFTLAPYIRSQISKWLAKH